MGRKHLKPETKLKKKINQTHKLATHALNDPPVWYPAPGYVYVKNVLIGELVTTEGGLRAIPIEKTESSVVVLVLRADHHPLQDRNFYLGKQRWASETEVKIIGD
tara:strand:+ start:2728 stop:3042 length:315 start_codon:yes stop_codon:yes gene_type:complete